MLQTNDPQAWQQLIELIAQRIANDIMSSDGLGHAPVLRDTVDHTNVKNINNARNHLRSVQLRQTT